MKRGWVRKRKRTEQDDINDAAVRQTLEMAVARELLTTWHWQKDNLNRNMWLRDALGRTEKFYGRGSPERIRKYMRVIEDENLGFSNRD